MKTSLFQHDNYERKSSKLVGETFQTAELSLKRRTDVFTLEDCPNWRQRWNDWTASTKSVGLIMHSKGERCNSVIVDVRFADCHMERAHSPCKFSLILFGHFYKNKARLQKHRQFIC